MSGLLVAGGVFREILLVADDSDTRELRLGGSGLYAAIAAARLGVDVTLLAPVGSEDRALAVALCDEAGVKPILLETPGPSGTFVINRVAGASPRPQYRPAGGRVLNTTGQSPDVDIVLAFGHPEWEPLADERVMRAAAEATLVWDQQGWLSRTPEATVVRTPARRRIQVGNAEELLGSTGRDPVPRIEDFPPPGFSASVVKDGRWGVEILEGNRQRTHIAAFRCDVRQTVGSGDIFAGALTAALADDSRLSDAAEVGAQAAAVWIRGLEPVPSQRFAESVALMRGQERLPVVSPDMLRRHTATILTGPALASRALADVTAARLGDLGLSTVRRTVAVDDHLVVELAGMTYQVAGGLELEPGRFASDLADFVTVALACS
ncbi:MAG: carbohydrate kinase family protein [Solirubrobacteraceae bacterium]